MYDEVGVEDRQVDEAANILASFSKSPKTNLCFNMQTFQPWRGKNVKQFSDYI